MWIFFPNAMLSIVAHRGNPDLLLVRARFKGDIERVFPGAKVKRTPRADYLYRAELPRLAMVALMAHHAGTMTYTNVKGAIPAGDVRRSRAMHDTWQVMFDAQHQAEPFAALDSREECGPPFPPRLHSGASYAHTTARGEPRVVYVHQVQNRTEGEPDVSLEFMETGKRYTMPLSRAQRWLRCSELLP